MFNKYLFLFVISSALIVIDQYTKLMVTLHIPINYSIKIVEGFFNLTHIRNSGVAFGIFSDQNSASELAFSVILPTEFGSVNRW